MQVLFQFPCTRAPTLHQRHQAGAYILAHILHVDVGVTALFYLICSTVGLCFRNMKYCDIVLSASCSILFIYPVRFRQSYLEICWYDMHRARVGLLTTHRANNHLDS